MTAPAGLPSYARDLVNHYTRLQARYATRDRNAELIHQVRKGNLRQMFPADLEFSLDFHGTPIANFVDIVARDMAEGIAPLPSLACVSGRMQTEADKKRAETKNRIGDNYWRHSRFAIQMLSGADRYVTYGFLPLFVEPDIDSKMPFIHCEDPRGAYYELDRYGCTKVYAKSWNKTVDDLCAMFPEVQAAIRFDKDGKAEPGDRELKMVRWVDDTHVTLFLPTRGGLILDRYEHRMSYCPVVIAERPGEDDSPRGQFDDVIWVQVARAIFMILALQAASDAVMSPIAVPSDTDTLNIGPKAIMQSDDAQSIHKLNFEIPQSAFAESASLDNELRVGSRYPEARSGAVNTSVITGKGVQALLGTFDSQIKGAQMIFKQALETATAFCFEMDETWWPNDSKTVTGTDAGNSYEFDYTPSKDINGRYACTVTYGFATGIDPAQSVVMMLQLEGAGLISKGTTQENLPFGIDALQESHKIDVEATREALKQGMFTLLGSAGQMVAQGQDPLPVIQMTVDMIHRLQKGSPVEDAVEQALQAMQEAQQQAQQAAAQAQGGEPGAGGDTGDQGDQNFWQAPGQAGLPPGGRPTLEQMIAGFRGNGQLPVDQLQIRRQVATGT